MKKNIIIGALMLIVGIVGGWLCRGYHFREKVKMVESDTVYVYKYKSYSHLDLKGSTYKLDAPVVGVPDVIFIREDATAVEYRDSIRYVALPRQYFFTSTDDVEIWHSGIDSTIDSLNVVVKTAEITKTAQAKVKKNYIGIGIEAGFLNSPYIPIYLEYERMFQKNMGFYSRMLYDLNTRQFGVSAGVNIQFEW